MRNDNRNSQFGSNRGDRRSGGRNFNNRGFGNNQDSSDRQMHKAVCSDCGQDCQVPFKPTGSKPIYCDDCFRKNKNKDTGRTKSFDNKQRGSSGDGQYKEQLNSINDKVGQILEILKSTSQTEKKESKESKEVKKNDKKIVKKTDKKPSKSAGRKVKKEKKK